jgi:hypothetical protein
LQVWQLLNQQHPGDGSPIIAAADPAFGFALFEDVHLGDHVTIGKDE